jgi:hypothetical protein
VHTEPVPEMQHWNGEGVPAWRAMYCSKGTGKLMRDVGSKIVLYTDYALRNE